MDLRHAVTVALLLSGCGRSGLLHPLSVRFDGGAVPAVDSGVVDAGVDAGVNACTQAPFGVDCCRNGARVSSASCENGAQVCPIGTVCTCSGAPQTFNCVDFCGTDAWVSPACVGGQWRCAQGLRRSSDCPAGTCWGSPGDCCVQPRCVEGQWTCESIAC